ncbi:MAG: DUF1285 domain-containing protein [Deltaproteobacteria bacterium]|nr:DUF1285 domain-containing protein [Deltaproteobacteria bacterium]
METDIPPCNIKIDKEGTWFYRGEEIFRKEIVNYFYQNLKRDESGQYIIETEDDCCYLEVEDAPFVVKTVYRFVSKSDEVEGIYLLLSDQSLEKLDPNTLWVGENNVPYCSVKNNTFCARFSRAGYYQFAEFVEYDDEKDAYFISVNGVIFYIHYVMPQEE